MNIVATDLEGTLTTTNTWKLVARYAKRSGKTNQYRLFWLSHILGLIASQIGLADKNRFREQWFADITIFIASATPDQQDQLWREIADEMWQCCRQAVIAELNQHVEAGCKIVVASGGYVNVVEKFAQRWCENEGWRRDTIYTVGTVIETDENGCATGAIEGPTCVREVKAQRIKSIIGEHKLLVAYGDTASDIPMLNYAESAVAVYPDKPLRDHAQAKKWRILEGAKR